MSRSAAIVGGGAFGVSAALALSRRGFDVRLIEAGRIPDPAASSTDTSKAVRPDYGNDEFYLEMALEAIEGWRRRDRDRGTSLFHPSGILMILPRTMNSGGFEAESFDRLKARGLPVERLEGEDLGNHFPAWSGSGYVDGYFNPVAGWVESGAAVAATRDEAISAGVQVQTGCRCVGLLEEGSRVVGVRLQDGDEIRADLIVVAAGAWTPILLPHLESMIWPVGQPVIYLEPGRPESFAEERFPVWCADISNTGWYGFPVTAEGKLKLGNHGAGKRFRPGDELVIDAEQQARAVEFATDRFPELADAPVVSSRLCLYCDSWDGNFLIDHDPDRPGLVVAAGGSGHGFKFEPILGEIVADVVEREPNRWASRFAWRRPGPRLTEHARFER